MKRIRSLLPLGVIGFLIVLGLLAGCYRPASPDVTATPAAGAEDAPSEPGLMATAAAESTRTAEMAAATATPTEVPPTSTPTPTATAQPASNNAGAASDPVGDLVGHLHGEAAGDCDEVSSPPPFLGYEPGLLKDVQMAREGAGADLC